MNTKQIRVFVEVVADGKKARRVLLIDWLVIDSAETIAEEIKGAILNIE